VLHESSNRARGHFIALNCAALPEHLIDDMLFGHEKGAFTGAHKEFKGLFEQAHGGTLFLDEIGEMPLHLQAKLLRVLQERQLTRLGSERPISLDVRVVAATNKDLKAAITQKEFREDLYFRISTFKLKVPALCDRPGDILPLVASLLMRHTHNSVSYTLSEEAQQRLIAYKWPGNVRELENVVQRAVVLCTNQHIESHHLMFDECSFVDIKFDEALLQTSEAPVLDANKGAQILSEFTPSLQTAVKSNEQQLILAAIQTTGTRIEAANKLGISPRTLRYKLAKLKNELPEMAIAS
jgi:two-component system response regulator FlrC